MEREKKRGAREKAYARQKISVARERGRSKERRRETMGRGRDEEGERGREREERQGREEDFPPPASSRDESNVRHEKTRGERIGKSAGDMEEEVSSSFHLHGCMPDAG